MTILIEVIRGKNLLPEAQDFEKCVCGEYVLKVQRLNLTTGEIDVAMVEGNFRCEFYRRNAEGILVAPDSEKVERALHSRFCVSENQGETKPFRGERSKK